MAVVYGVKGSDKDGNNGAGTGDDVQGGGSNGATLWELELGRYIANAGGYGGVPSLVAWGIAGISYQRVGKGGMGVVIGGRGIGGDRDVANKGVHLEESGYHCRIYNESPHL